MPWWRLMGGAKGALVEADGWEARWEEKKLLTRMMGREEASRTDDGKRRSFSHGWWEEKNLLTRMMGREEASHTDDGANCCCRVCRCGERCRACATWRRCCSSTCRPARSACRLSHTTRPARPAGRHPKPRGPLGTQSCDAAAPRGVTPGPVGTPTSTCPSNHGQPSAGPVGARGCRRAAQPKGWARVWRGLGQGIGPGSGAVARGSNGSTGSGEWASICVSLA